MESISGIYVFTNKINNKQYVGQSFNIRDRVNQHKYRAGCKNDSGYNMPLHLAIRKYGWDNFEIKIIEKCSPEKLDAQEKYWIKKLDTISPKGYNILAGGQSNRKNPNICICPYCSGYKYRTAKMCKECRKKILKKDDEIDFKQILVEILDTNFEQASKKFGYNNSNSLRKRLKKRGFPIHRRDIYDWYEKEFNKKHDNILRKGQREKERFNNKEKVSPKQIGMFTKEGGLIATFPSTREAGRRMNIRNNHIVECANGKIKSYKGYIWKYI